MLVGRISTRLSSPGFAPFLGRSMWVFLHHTSGNTYGPDGFNVRQTRLHGDSSVESGFEHEGPEIETLTAGRSDLKCR
ncbi:hypothetical protein AVEN_106321-1 [Araneus ventricosus]|uniref:Uncharacterized protein n=1 Tax=Araneus ventricosus TaxID=182803 RepID=A0A4Y2ASD7_ARAVE|nr:hypothetical protein AVEN_106321-1 [Araneus ventricosus]